MDFQVEIFSLLHTVFIYWFCFLQCQTSDVFLNMTHYCFHLFIASILTSIDFLSSDQLHKTICEKYSGKLDFKDCFLA